MIENDRLTPPLALEQNVARVQDLLGRMHSVGSYGLFVPKAEDAGAIIDGLKKSVENKTWLLRPEGNVQGESRQGSAEGFMLALRKFEELNHENGLFIFQGYNFRDFEAGGTPGIREYFQQTINLGKSPMVLAIGRGDARTVRALQSHRSEVPVRPENRTLAQDLGGIAIVNRGQIHFVDDVETTAGIEPQNKPPVDRHNGNSPRLGL